MIGMTCCSSRLSPRIAMPGTSRPSAYTSLPVSLPSHSSGASRSLHLVRKRVIQSSGFSFALGCCLAMASTARARSSTGPSL